MRITCVIDNSVAQSSRLWGEHGLSFHIQTNDGTILLDTGRSGTVLMHNLERLELDPRRLSALVLSHSHEDHTGGLPSLLEKVSGLPLYASRQVFRPRFVGKNGEYRQSGIPIAEVRLKELVNLRLSAEPQEVLPGVWTTGEIAPRREPEGRSPGHVVPVASGWSPDPYADDMSIVMETRDGLVVVCGCCHAGLLNTLAQVKRTFGGTIVAIMGGTHVRDSDTALYDHIVAVLRDEYGSPHLFVNHCTGTRAFMALAGAFGERAAPCPAGTIVDFP